MEKGHLVNVIIPCYQAEKFVSEAIESVLSQTYSNVEIIAIDDGSTDKTLPILKEYEGLITILQHPGGVNRGVSFARKLGVDHAKGKYIAFLDADDYFEPTKIAAQVDALEKNHESVLCHTAINLICNQDNHFDYEGHFKISIENEVYDLKKTSSYLTSNRICNSSVVINSRVLKTIPYYGEQLFQFEDWIMWTLAAEYGKFLYISDKLTNYRFHKESSTSAVSESRAKNVYSHIEFYLTLLTKPVSRNVKYKCAYMILKKLESLCKVYESSADNDTDMPKKCGSLSIPFLVSSIKFFINKANMMRKITKPLRKS
jgi:glycosyltransferase involved in cell wall biosynthesis